jgi:tyrosinase
MATFTRRNAWNNNGTFNNPDLLWYAKAVEVMQSRHLDDPTSWWFFAAIHGQTLTRPAPPRTFKWADIKSQPNVPTTPLPPQGLMDQYWDQCQHGTWFFPPWHRGYLFAIENILRGIILKLGGPGDWALPYWNYFGPAKEFQIPPAFTEQKLPDGTPNALLVKHRYGPNNDGHIFIPLSSWGITQQCQRLTDYTGVNPNFYGGDETGFNHNSGPLGALEYNPHGAVHVAIGGQTPSGTGGLMSKPPTAALDPIFYLHHSNIDRMWAAWNKAGRANPTNQKWLNGPWATADRKFFMPKPDKTPWQYTSAMVNDTNQLDYTYQDLSLGIAVPFMSTNALRLLNFGLTEDEIKAFNEMSVKNTSELVGANSSRITIDAKGVRTTVKLDSKGWNTVTRSLTNTFKALTDSTVAASLPDELYLQLEGVKGNEDSVVCSVSVNGHYAGHLYLFGLSDASMKDGQHGGAGLTISLDITRIADQLHLKNELDSSGLDVLIQPVNIVAEGSELTIDRVSIYRKGQS